MNNPLSKLAESMVGSEIVRIGNAINEQISAGTEIYNYTIGDFAPSVFPVPSGLLAEILKAYQNGATNYPPAAGVLALRTAVASFLQKYEEIDYSEEEIQIASGGRPLIYSFFKTIVDAGDKVIYAIPSWNNNHYTFLNGGEACEIVASPENCFLPTAEEIAPHLSEAVLLCLCTPQNPTGTALAKAELEKICDLVLAENAKRKPEEKKLYVLFDQMYWTLTYGSTKHFHPVQLRPEMKDYTLTVDGVSKAFAATGVRVGWGLGPQRVMAKVKALLSHVGAWAPMAEQVAVAAFLKKDAEVWDFLNGFKKQLEERLWRLYHGFEKLRQEGYPIQVIEPQAAIYLTVKLDLAGSSLTDGTKISAQSEVTAFLLKKAGVGLVPFICFGASAESPWYRVSVGTSTLEDIDQMFEKFSKALALLQLPEKANLNPFE